MNTMQVNMLNPIWLPLLIAVVIVILGFLIQAFQIVTGKQKLAPLTAKSALRSSVWLAVVIVACTYLFG